MSLHYGKLFSSITESTIWSEPLATRVVWVTLIAKCDRQGRWFGSSHGLARQANVSVDEAQEAMQRFQQPDPSSTSPEYDGRRIEAIEGGYRLLNHRKYRDLMNSDRERERKRAWDRKNRPSGYARASDDSPTSPKKSEGDRRTPMQSDGAQSIKSDESPTQTTQVELEVDVDKDKTPPTPLGGVRTRTGRRRTRGTLDGFDEFKAAYPRREAWGRAEEAWQRQGCAEPGIRAAIAAAIPWQVQTGRLKPETREGRSIVPLPASWLNSRGWEDERPRNGSNGHHAPPSAEDQAAQATISIRSDCNNAWSEIVSAAKLGVPPRPLDPHAAAALERIGGLDALHGIKPFDLNAKGREFGTAYMTHHRDTET